MTWVVRLVRDRYVDSVRLMQVAQAVRGSDGVAGCDLVMGTPANLEQLRARGVKCDATPADVVIAVDGPAGALELAERELSAAPAAATQAAGTAPPRSLGAATRELGGANVALISLPGEYAVLEAHRALTLGLHVFLFSDHVGVADEVALKRRGAELGLLVMGPGCGTAMLGGVGLGFANVVRSGPIGIVAAAGTGAQEASVLVDGVGVSQIIGVGGRDLSSEVGALMFREGMKLLAADDETETLLLVSKPPDRDAVQALADVDARGKRVVAAFVGWDGGEAPFEVHPTLEGGAYAAIGGAPPGDPQTPRGPGGNVLGLYSGGSLAHEAETILGDGHTILDLGEEEYTQGRPHPMVDLGVRLEMLRAVQDDVGCVLLDVVLGHGSHLDPAGELVQALPRDRPVIAHVCGTAADPQDARRQEATLREAGVIVAPTNASAARVAKAVAA
jgi:FdrA protein